MTPSAVAKLIEKWRSTDILNSGVARYAIIERRCADELEVALRVDQEAEHESRWIMCKGALAKLLDQALAAHDQKLRAEVLEEAAHHYPTNVVNRGERSASVEGWTQCACGEAIADGVTPYKEIWQQHIRSLASGAVEKK